MTRFIEVEFRPGGKRYTYKVPQSITEPLEAGKDRVDIITKDGEGTFRVLNVHEVTPSYACKEILRVLPRAVTVWDPIANTGDPSAQ